MNTSTTHKKTHIVFTAIGIAMCFSVLSVFLFLKQANNHEHQTAGKILTVSKSEVVISNRKTEEITLILTEDTKILSMNEGLEPGMFIHSFGSWVATSTLDSHSIRVIKKQ